MENNVSITEQYKEQVRRMTHISADEFERLESSMVHLREIEEEHIHHTTKEDQQLDALHLNLAKSFNSIYPRKNESEGLPNGDSKIPKKESNKSQNLFIYCSKILNRVASVVCVNATCPEPFICQTAIKKHHKVCNRENMTIPIQEVLDLEMLDTNCFNPEEFDYEEKIDIVKNVVRESKEKLNQMFDILLRNSINKLCHESKEFKMKQLRKIIEEKVEKFNSKINKMKEQLIIFTK